LSDRQRLANADADGCTVVAPAFMDDDMIAVMLHKPDVWLELHGWSPKYLGDALKHEISRRLKHKVMFGADYPLFTYERLTADWEGLGLDQASLQRVYTENAKRLFPSLAESG